MVSKKTLKKIVKVIENDVVYRARVLGHYYSIYYDKDEDCVIAEPVGSGDVVRSGMRVDRLEYAGKVYRAVVELVDDVNELMRERMVEKDVKSEKEEREDEEKEDGEKNVSDWQFRDARGDLQVFEVEETWFGRGVRGHVCPLCSQVRLYARGCASGHISIYPVRIGEVFIEVNSEGEELDSEGEVVEW